MLYIVLAVILLVLLAIALLIGVVGKEFGGIVAAGAVVVVLLILTGFNSFKTVEARSVAVQTSFGHYDTTLEPGPHWIAPWASIEDFTTTVQKVDYSDVVEGGGNKVPVTFSGGGSGWIDLTVNWHITDAGVEKVWANHRTFEGLNSNFTNSAVKEAVVNAANDFTSNEARADQAKVRDHIYSNLASVFALKGLALDAVYVTSVPLSDATQANLNKVVEAENNIQRATAEQQRAKIDAETAKIRAAAGSNAPEAIARYCLEIANTWDLAKNGPLPATFNCGLGDSKTQVLVGAGK